MLRIDGMIEAEKPICKSRACAYFGIIFSSPLSSKASNQIIAVLFIYR